MPFLPPNQQCQSIEGSKISFQSDYFSTAINNNVMALKAIIKNWSACTLTAGCGAHIQEI